ncbi:MAG: HD family phosphohydrolase [Cyclonatronaceae bacterium]
MSIMEKLGLARKKKTHVTLFSEKKGDTGTPQRKQITVKALISVLFVSAIVVLYPRTPVQEFTYRVGEPWRQNDLVAPFTFSLLKGEDEIEAEVREIREVTPPIFHLDNAAETRISAALDSLFSRMKPVLDRYAEWQINKAAGSEDATRDSLRFVQQQAVANVSLNDEGWRVLLENYTLMRRDQQRRGSTDRRFIGEEIRLRINRFINDALQQGIINVSKDRFSSDELLVRDLSERTQRSFSFSTVREIPEVMDLAMFQLPRQLPDQAVPAALQLLDAVIQPNFIYNENETEAQISQAIENISPTKGAVTSGQVIIRKGDLINAERQNILNSLDQARMSRASSFELWQYYIGDTLLILAVFSVFLFYLYLYRRPIFDNNSMFLLVFLAIGIVLGASLFVARIDTIPSYVVPLALAPIILTIIFDSRVGLMATTVIALATALIHGNNFEFLLATITACSIGVFSVRDIRKRSQFFLTTPALVFIAYVFVLLGFTLTRTGGWDLLAVNILHVFLNALLVSLLTYPVIFLFEKLFKVTTDVTLYELNDNNHPILKALMMRAPGSFQHSLQVSNLSEAAAAAIGANSLLCRVGALFHDIGKMEKPHYFVENQSGGMNEHDKLKPRMSAMVIKNHVATGVKMAEEEGLPEVIIDFIKTHHGTSVIRYFHGKAKDLAEDDTEIREEDFRYDGPLPETKETGILLLADCIEAASRAMTDPTYQKLENLVVRMVDERMAEGQLNNCPLTFQDLRIIKDSFLKILVGMYHGRIKYPGQDQKDNAPRKADSRKLAKPAGVETNPENTPIEPD